MKSITTAEAAAIIGASPAYVREAMRKKEINIGSCVKLKEGNKNWAFNISPPLLAGYSGKDIEKELKILRGDSHYFTKKELIKCLRSIIDFLSLSNEGVREYVGEVDKGEEYAVKAGKTQTDISELIKELESKELVD